MEETPKRVGRYEILSVQGRGAMGIVYKAKDPLIGRLVAIKMIALSGLLQDRQREEFKERFFQEARAAGVLNHPNVVSIFDLGEEGGVPFMAMEYVEGRSLTELLRAGEPVPLARAAGIVRQVAEALSYAHEKGIVHRDIKPDNILIDDQGRAVVTDFGVARLSTSDLTRTGEVLGTPHFMSPEQILGDPVDGRSDLFSLGVVFYQLLAGRRPFKGDSISSVCYHIVHSPPEPLPEDRRVPPEVAPILARMLAKKREERFVSAAEAALALDEAVPGTRSFMPSGLYRAEDTATVPPPSPPPPAPAATVAKPPPPPPKTFRVLYLLLPAGLLLGCLLAVAVGVGIASKLDGGEVPGPAAEEPPPEEAGEPEPGRTAPEEPRRGGDGGETPSRVREDPKPKPAPAEDPKPEAPTGGRGTPGPLPDPAPAAKRGAVSLIFEGRVAHGRIQLYLDDALVWDTTFKEVPGADGKILARVERRFPLPPGGHRYRIVAAGAAGFRAQAAAAFTLGEGEHRILKVVPRRFPARLEIREIEAGEP